MDLKEILAGCLELDSYRHLHVCIALSQGHAGS